MSWGGWYYKEASLTLDTSGPAKIWGGWYYKEASLTLDTSGPAKIFELDIPQMEPICLGNLTVMCYVNTVVCISSSPTPSWWVLKHVL